MRFFALITSVAVIVTALLIWGLLRIDYQTQLTTTYEPTRATIIETHVHKTWFGFYRPVITYRYQIGGQIYASTKYAPLNQFGSQPWASKVAEQYQPQQVTTAYVSTQNLMMAFLTPHTTFTPYIATIFSMLLIFMTCFLIRNAGIFSSKPHTPHHPNRYHWYQLTTEHIPSFYAFGMIFISLLWSILILLPFIHFLLFAYYDHEHTRLIIPTLITIIAVMLTLIPATMGFSALHTAKPIKTIRALTTQPQIFLDAPLAIRTDLLFAKACEIQSIKINLTCKQLTGITSRTCFSMTHTIQQHQHILPGQTITGSHRFSVPPSKQRPSSHFTRFDYPRIAWAVEIHTTFINNRTLTWCFPIAAERTTSER
ncbi:DUF3592 domain-containing protein [Poriferisphaera corsica]|uniref:DUF3592 domain-containing protein n=1 Tax=Poriferisphaera corsica TaxID=2528020 RepID=UPI00190A8295|nr:DUF3592 domain-containing protein [Poriferisphaera corsica]